MKISHFGIATCQLAENNVTGTLKNFKMQDIQCCGGFLYQNFQLHRMKGLGSLVETLDTFQKMSCRVSGPSSCC